MVDQVILNRSLLSNDQQREYREWEDFFASPAWKRLVIREDNNIALLQSKYSTVQGPQALGYLQGSLQTITRVFVHLPDLINAEYLILTGQLDQGEDLSSEDPVQPLNWSD